MSAAPAAYVYVWEYLVAPEHEVAFEHQYGPDGEWVRLFKTAPGYVKTELLRDHTNRARFITIDSWESEAAWTAFRARSAEAFEAIDARCDALTLSETLIGTFHPVTNAEGC